MAPLSLWQRSGRTPRTPFADEAGALGSPRGEADGGDAGGGLSRGAVEKLAEIAAVRPPMFKGQSLEQVVASSARPSPGAEWGAAAAAACGRSSTAGGSLSESESERLRRKSSGEGGGGSCGSGAGGSAEASAVAPWRTFAKTPRWWALAAAPWPHRVATVGRPGLRGAPPELVLASLTPPSPGRADIDVIELYSVVSFVNELLRDEGHATGPRSWALPLSPTDAVGERCLFRAVQDGSLLLLLLARCRDEARQPRFSHARPLQQRIIEERSSREEGWSSSNLHSSSASTGTLGGRGSPGAAAPSAPLVAHAQALREAREMGFDVEGLTAEGLQSGDRTMVMALLWQAVHAVLLAPVAVDSCAELEALLLPGEEHSAAPDELLFRWLNHHLHQGNRHERVASWTDPNLRSGIAYAVLLDEVAPPRMRFRLGALREAALAARRARVVLDLETLGVTAFRVNAAGLGAASPKVHRCLAAAIFGRHHGLRAYARAVDDVTPRQQGVYDLPSQLDAAARHAAARTGVPQVAQLALEAERGIDLGSAFHTYSLATLLEVRNTVRPIGVHLATLFGFQMEQPATGSDPGADAVPSNLDNQVDHLSKLIKNTMDRLDARTGYLPAFQAAVGEVHGQVLGNYTRWVEHVGLSGAHAAIVPDPTESYGPGDVFTTIGSLTASKWDTTGLFAFATAEEEQRWLCTAQLHQLLLWQLVWGEAANLRHAPEMLTLVFHCAANAVKLPPQTPPLRPGSTSLYLLPGSPMPYPANDFLVSVVRPVYLFLRRETFERREEPVGERVMYDDVNEFFWYRDRLQLLLGDSVLRDPRRLREAYGQLRATLSGAVPIRPALDAAASTLSRNASCGATDRGGGGGGGDDDVGDAEVPTEGAATRLSRLFTKSFCEQTTWLNVVHIFYRVYLLHTLMLHLSVVLAFVPPDSARFNSCLATLSLTHAFWKTLRQLVDVKVGHPPRGADSLTLGRGASVGQNKVRTSHVVHICGYLLVPGVFAAELAWKHAEPAQRQEGVFENLVVFQLVALLYLSAHAAAHVLLLRPGRVRRSFLRAETQAYVGAQEQLAVPWVTCACYTTFWLCTLGVKFVFGHYMLVMPLVEPLTTLWNYQDQCWASANFCAPKVPGAIEVSGERYVRQLAFTVLLITVRAVVPLLVYFFDTFIWYTLTSSSVSIFLATYQRIGRVSSWSQLVRHHPPPLLPSAHKTTSLAKVQRPPPRPTHHHPPCPGAHARPVGRALQSEAPQRRARHRRRRRRHQPARAAHHAPAARAARLHRALPRKGGRAGGRAPPVGARRQLRLRAAQPAVAVLRARVERDRDLAARRRPALRRGGRQPLLPLPRRRGGLRRARVRHLPVDAHLARLHAARRARRLPDVVPVVRAHAAPDSRPRRVVARHARRRAHERAAGARHLALRARARRGAAARAPAARRPGWAAAAAHGGGGAATGGDARARGGARGGAAAGRGGRRCGHGERALIGRRAAVGGSGDGAGGGRRGGAGGRRDPAEAAARAAHGRDGGV